MTDMMNFPERWEDFLHDYEFEDARRIYTNGSRLIPSFRVKQMMEHYAPVRYGRWVLDEYARYFSCSACGTQFDDETDTYRNIMNGFAPNYCEDCGAKMDLEVPNGNE